MVLIHATNILVDDFKFSRPFRSSYIYFLTHFHADHYEGLSPSWRNEKIYCSEVTKKLLLHRYPHLKNVDGLEVNVPHTIYLDPNRKLFVMVTLLDANHCMGSVMLLFEGYMGTILNTGDFRFTKKMFEDSRILYPSHKMNPAKEECSIHIDEVMMDDTYCDPVFKFPTKSEVLKAITRIIDNAPKKRICIALDTVGKEELLIFLAKHYNTKIIVDKDKHDFLTLADYFLDCFTQEGEEGFIEVIRKHWARSRLEKGCVVILPTGWCNQLVTETEPNYFLVGYSLHSNYEELCTFVKSIKPGRLTTQWKTQAQKKHPEKLNQECLSHIEYLKKFKQKGLEYLQSDFVDSSKLSDEYKFFLDLENLIVIKKELGLPTVDEKRALTQQRILEQQEEESNILNLRDNKVRTGARVFAPEHNPFLEIEERNWIRKGDGNGELERDFEWEVTQVREDIHREPEPMEEEKESPWKMRVNEDRYRKRPQEDGLEFSEQERRKVVYTKKSSSHVKVYSTKQKEYREENYTEEAVYKTPVTAGRDINDENCGDDIYLPFSEGSDDEKMTLKEDSVIQIDDTQAMQLEREEELKRRMSLIIEIEEDNTQQAEEVLIMDDPIPINNIQKIYSGVMSLTIESKGRKGSISEVFALYTEDLGKQVQSMIPATLDIGETANYSSIKPLLNTILKNVNNPKEKKYVIGWVESEQEGKSMLTSLSEHMRKHNLVRICRIGRDSSIYFFHPSQVNYEVHKQAPMIFIIFI